MTIDIILALVIALGFWRGFSKGIIRTVFGIVAMVVGLIAALKLSPLTIGAMDSLIPNNPRLTYILGFILTFIVVMLLVTFIGNRIEKLMKTVNLNIFNKIAGGVTTAVFFLFLFSCVLWFMNEARLISESQKDQSLTYYHLEPIPTAARAQFESMKPMFQEFWNKTIDVFDQVKEKGEAIQQENSTIPGEE